MSKKIEHQCAIVITYYQGDIDRHGKQGMEEIRYQTRKFMFRVADLVDLELHPMRVYKNFEENDKGERLAIYSDVWVFETSPRIKYALTGSAFRNYLSACADYWNSHTGRAVFVMRLPHDFGEPG